MNESTYFSENSTGFHKENSPPFPMDKADGFGSYNNGQHTAGLNISRDYTKKILDKAVTQHQPLQINNHQFPSNKQNVQPELLKKFRQLRQWQQQQQETMFRKQQQQMDNIKIQQERFQALFNKSSTSPKTLSHSLNKQSDTQLDREMCHGEEPISVVPIDDLLRKMPYKNEPINSNKVSPVKNQGYLNKESQQEKTTSPILMTPMHFTTRSSFSSTSPQDMFSKIEQPNIPLSNGSSSPHLAVKHLNTDMEVLTSDNESDNHSDTETMSGVFPLLDDNISEVCPIELDENESKNTDREDDLENTVCERPTNSDQNIQETQTIEDRPINPGIGFSKASTFEEFLERELKSGPSYLQENSNTPVPASPSPKKKEEKKPQKTFLKKGQGLSRFKMKPLQAKKPKGSKKSPPEKKQPGLSKVVVEGKDERTSLLQQSVPQIKVQRKVAGRGSQDSPGTLITCQSFGSSILSSHVIGPFTSMPHTLTTNSIAVTKTTLATAMKSGPSPPAGHLLTPLTSLNFSFEHANKEIEDTKEDEDLEEFEMLEEAAANASFSSNSSLVTKVIQRAKAKAMGNQYKPDTLPTNQGSPINIPTILSPVDTGYGSSEGRQPDSINVASQASSIVDNVTEIDVSENEDNDNDTTLKDEFDQQPHDNRTLQDFDDEEAWHEIKAQRESTESDNDSDDSDVTIGEPFSFTRLLPAMQQIPVAEVPSSPAKIISTPPASALMSKLFPKLKEKQKVEEVNATQKEKQQPAIEVAAGPSKEVQEKLKELEEEISKFRAENKALAKIRIERDEGLKRLQNEIDLFEKQKTDELERIEKFKKEEMQKLKRERKVFEKYQKAAKTIPDKKEREEIEALKSQVSELQDEIKRRESRWSAASSRYRNRIEALEEQNKELQEEVKLLEKYRLEKWRENEIKAKDNEETTPRDVILRKTAKHFELAQPAVLGQSGHHEAVNSDDTSACLQSPSDLGPVGQNERPKDANNNMRKENLSNTSKKSSPLVSPKLSSPFANKRTLCKQGINSNENKNHLDEENSGPNVQKKLNGLQEIEHPDGKVEQVQPDGSRVILFTNGTKKEISKDGQTVIVSFFNGDIKQVFPDQRVVYHYSQAKTTHTTYPDGLEVLRFPNNQIEKHYVDGTKEIIFPDQTIKYLYIDGTEECVYADGTIQRTRGADGEKIIEFPNGQREVHTKLFKRREYPDGTVKTVYPDGRTETRYSSGRLRVKDRDGRVVMDTEHQE